MSNNFSDELFKNMNRIIKTYPNGIKRVPNKRISGRAFFPGGDGLFDTKTVFPKHGILILGQDFDNECNFKIRVDEGSEKKNNTWHYLEEILKDNRIPTEECFFTNAIMGLREGDKKNSGKSKAFKKRDESSKAFLDKCQRFFLEQVKTQKPKLIIGLGAHMPEFLSKTSIKLNCLEKITSLSKIGELSEIADKVKANIFKDVEFSGIDDFKTIVIFITHPSMYPVNVKKRVKNGNDDDGKKFEYCLIKEAYKTANK